MRIKKGLRPEILSHKSLLSLLDENRYAKVYGVKNENNAEHDGRIIGKAVDANQKDTEHKGDNADNEFDIESGRRFLGRRDQDDGVQKEERAERDQEVRNVSEDDAGKFIDHKHNTERDDRSARDRSAADEFFRFNKRRRKQSESENKDADADNNAHCRRQNARAAEQNTDDKQNDAQNDGLHVGVA